MAEKIRFRKVRVGQVFRDKVGKFRRIHKRFIDKLNDLVLRRDRQKVNARSTSNPHCWRFLEDCDLVSLVK